MQAVRAVMGFQRDRFAIWKIANLPKYQR